jgi:3-dehydroquinate synthase
MSLIKLKTLAGETDILVPGSMEQLEERVSPDSTILIVDENVLTFHQDKLEGFSVIPVKQGEQSKSLESYADIFRQLLEMDIDRTWKLVGVGGGIVTDLAGFVASTYFRGIPFGYVSTTLLGQVDAAIGGKNGINYDGFKNLIGVIKQPEFVFCDLESLKTLPKKEFIGGFSEIIKYAFIRRAELFPYLSENLDAALEFDMDILNYLVNESIKVKVEIVSADEFEKGDRKLLNFGHTFGHALEKIYKVSHGEAVAIGMMLATKMSLKLGMIDQDILRSLENLLIKAGLPVHLEFNAHDMAETMKKDKKRKKDAVDFILLEGIGNAVIKDIPIKDLTLLLHDLR